MSTAKSGARGKPRRGGRAAPGRPGGGGNETVLLYGLHVCAAALDNPRREILAALATPNAAERLEVQFRARGIGPEITTPERISARVGPEAVHQGIAVEARPLSPVAFSAIAPASPVIALDQVTDPRNLGAILRVGAAFGAGGLITTRRHAATESGLVAKAASGGLEHVPMIEVANLVRALGEARAAGYWIAGLDSEGPHPFDDIAGHRPLVLVMGAEGQGLRRLTREACDGLYRIALPGPIRSINVSTATALALQIVSRAGA